MQTQEKRDAMTGFSRPGYPPSPEDPAFEAREAARAASEAAGTQFDAQEARFRMLRWMFGIWVALSLVLIFGAFFMGVGLTVAQRVF